MELMELMVCPPSWQELYSKGPFDGIDGIDGPVVSLLDETCPEGPLNWAVPSRVSPGSIPGLARFGIPRRKRSI